MNRLQRAAWTLVRHLPTCTEVEAAVDGCGAMVGESLAATKAQGLDDDGRDVWWKEGGGKQRTGTGLPQLGFVTTRRRLPDQSHN